MKRLLRSRLLSLALVLAAPACTDVRFGGSVLGGDARAPLDAPVIVDAPDDGDGADAHEPDARTDADDASEVEASVDAGCTDDRACTDPELPVCDRATGRCVGCDPGDDRCPRGRYCNPSMRACVDGCRVDDDCGGSNRLCDVGRHVCVACRRDAECGAGAFCVGGQCTTTCSETVPCGAGQTCCAGVCIDVARDAMNCGACGRVCAVPSAVAVCAAGACAVGSCADGAGDCDGDARNGCETELRSTLHCGACDRVCPVRPNATPTCDARGVCGSVCRAGFLDCDGEALNGCEVSSRDDVANCGACGSACAFPSGRAACAGGRCVLAACVEGRGDCDGDARNGCEADLRASTASCGACGRVCSAGPNATARCDFGVCAVTCNAGFADCDGSAANGCEVDTRTSALHCGACGRSCAAAGATTSCAGGVCSVTRCAGTTADCNGLVGDGCEVDTATSLRHCGSCGRSCAAGQVCVAGACVIDCGGLTRCGVSCADLRIDSLNCGACGRACGVGESCMAGVCTLVCASPTTACAGRCVATASDRANCGACGNACATAPNATATCTGGACGVACVSGFSDCDGAAANGCETATATSATNCGVCGARCAFTNAAATCVGGRCAMGACAAGFADCDGSAANGCEAALASDPRNCGRCGTVCATSCAAGVCAPVTVIDGPTVVNTLAAPVTALAGTRAAMLVGTTTPTFAPGTAVLLHQTQGAADEVGVWEVNRVVASSGPSIQLESALRGRYTTAGATARAQIVAIAQYDDLLVASGGELTAPEWNGSTGGVLAVETRGDLVVRGTITMAARGFRGNRRTCGGANRCQYGVQGESWAGRGGASIAANAGGGGGGGRGQDCGAGGGGAYGPGAGRGSAGDCNGDVEGLCAMQCPNEGGAAGAAYAGGAPGEVLHLGSAGGEGGADEDGSLPGGGGNGGGIVWLRVGGALSVAGTVSANGADGFHGDQFSCGGSGCGMGGGGGGAGGAVRVIAARATIGAGAVTATGGAGGQCSCRTLDVARAAPAGRGGAGRVSVVATSVVGSSVPAYEAR